MYLEDVDSSIPKTPSKAKVPDPPSSKRKSKFYDHDPYQLPVVNLEEEVAKATRSAAPDPRLATEEELRAFIEDMRPEDFDVTSPAFRELPTEVQYEIVGDLRLKSRQTSYARLQNMLRNAHTPLDFSKQQIQNLRQRNSLTQQLLVTTDSIGSAHISIPVRVASERNKEYILVKNQGESGGWILGIRDDGTREKPIEIDQEEDNEGSERASDGEMEEVSMCVHYTQLSTDIVQYQLSPSQIAPDLDLREYQAHMALSAIGNRSQQKRFPSATKSFQKAKSTPLFEFDDAEDGLPSSTNILQDSGEDDEELAFAVQDSLDQMRSAKVSHIIDVDSSLPLSKISNDVDMVDYPAHLPSSKRPSKDEHIFAFQSPTRLETALSIAGAGPSRAQHSPLSSKSVLPAFGRPALLSPFRQPPSTPSLPQGELDSLAVTRDTSTPPRPERPFVSAHAPDVGTISDSDDDLEEVARFLPVVEPMVATPSVVEGAGTTDVRIVSDSDSNTDMEEIIPQYNVLRTSNALDKMHSPIYRNPPSTSLIDDQPNTSPSHTPGLRSFNRRERSDASSPFRQPSDASGSPRSSSPVHDSWDAAQEMDPHAEEGEFARFLSQVKGKNIDDVRREIDDEIKHLNQQKKAAMRDSDDITQQMISQIMVSWNLFTTPIPLNVHYADHASSFWHSIHYSTDGGRSPMRRTGLPWTCRWRHHR